MKKKYSEKELLSNSADQLFSVSKEIKNNPNALKDISENLKCWFHINSKSDFSLSYMNQQMLCDFDVDFAEVKKLGPEFLVRISHPQSTKEVLPLLTKFLSRNDKNEVISFEQSNRVIGQRDYRKHISLTKLHPDKKSIISTTFPAKYLENFIEQKLFANNEIFKKYYHRFSILTKREKQILSLIALGKENKEIGEILFISSNTVKTHRNNLTRKLETSKVAELTRIAIYFEIVSESF